MRELQGYPFWHFRKDLAKGSSTFSKDIITLYGTVLYDKLHTSHNIIYGVLLIALEIMIESFYEYQNYDMTKNC